MLLYVLESNTAVEVDDNLQFKNYYYSNSIPGRLVKVLINRAQREYILLILIVLIIETVNINSTTSRALALDLLL